MNGDGARTETIKTQRQWWHKEAKERLTQSAHGFGNFRFQLGHTVVPLPETVTLHAPILANGYLCCIVSALILNWTCA